MLKLGLFLFLHLISQHMCVIWGTGDASASICLFNAGPVCERPLRCSGMIHTAAPATLVQAGGMVWDNLLAANTSLMAGLSLGQSRDPVLGVADDGNGGGFSPMGMREAHFADPNCAHQLRLLCHILRYSQGNGCSSSANLDLEVVCTYLADQVLQKNLRA